MTGADLGKLRGDWVRQLAPLGCGAAEAEAAFRDLATRYGEPHRHYHTLDHVAEVLNGVRRLCPEADHHPALLLAGWFHDAVYDTRASDNEERSAEHAREVLGKLGVPGAVVEETARLVLLTRAHATSPEDNSGQVLLDSDLAVLGAEERVYDSYARAIRREYEWVPPERYREGRRRVLEGFLARPRIYATGAMFAAAELQARANLHREVEVLGW